MNAEKYYKYFKYDIYKPLFEEICYHYYDIVYFNFETFYFWNKVTLFSLNESRQFLIRPFKRSSLKEKIRQEYAYAAQISEDIIVNVNYVSRLEGHVVSLDTGAQFVVDDRYLQKLQSTLLDVAKNY